jgi:hypothetical protein
MATTLRLCRLFLALKREPIVELATSLQNLLLELDLKYARPELASYEDPFVFRVIGDAV